MTEEREALKGLLAHTFLFRGAPEEALEAALSDRPGHLAAGGEG